MRSQDDASSQIDDELQKFLNFPDDEFDQSHFPPFSAFSADETILAPLYTQQNNNGYGQNDYEEKLKGARSLHDAVDMGQGSQLIEAGEFAFDECDPAWFQPFTREAAPNLHSTDCQQETNFGTSSVANNIVGPRQHLQSLDWSNNLNTSSEKSLASTGEIPMRNTFGFWNSATSIEPPPHNGHSFPRRRSRYHAQRKGKQSIGIHTPLNILSNHHDDLHHGLEPIQRWRNSPPEDEPASMFAISEALSGIEAGMSAQEIASDLKGYAHEDTKLHTRYQRPRSVASSLDSDRSGSSMHSGTSHRSSRTAPVQRRVSGANTPRRRSKGVRNADKDEVRLFHCTFCCDTFKRKYDWTRHEKSLHLNLEGWTCTSYGGSVLSQPSNRIVCAYCNMLEPSMEHLETHNHEACHGENAPSRTFRRKDHLVQHLRLVHRLDTLPVIDDWRIEPPPIRSRCGFCDFEMYTWEERQNHLAVHFHKGLTMRHWHGDHEFEPVVAAQIKNALPPYLLGSESQSVVPFSATNASTMDHYEQILSHSRTNRLSEEAQIQQGQTNNLTTDQPSQGFQAYIELLTSHLAAFAQDCARKGIVPTDEMFQCESRKVHFDCDDPWEQTVADNTEWLATFRQQQNLG